MRRWVDSESERSDAAISRTVLVVDARRALREQLARALRRRGYEVWTASRPQDAIVLARVEAPAYALVDLRMPRPPGLHVVFKLRELDDATCMAMFTGYGNVATAIDAVRLGAVRYLTRPANVDDVVAAFGSAGHGGKPSTSVPSLERLQRDHIQSVMSRCSNNVTQAAKLLGLHRRSLQRKLARLTTVAERQVR